MDERIFGRTKGGDSVLRRNFWVNVFDGALFAFGLSLASQQTVLPVFVKHLGGGNVALGLIPVLWTAGFNFPQIFVARRVQKHAKKKGMFLKTAIIQRLPWLLLAIVSFFVIDRVDSSVGVILFLSLFTLAAVAGSINFPLWFDLVAKLTPVDLRGRMLATRNLAGGILGILGGWIVERVLEGLAYPANFGFLFLLAILAMTGSYGFLLCLREDTDSVVTTPVKRKEFWRKLRTIIRHEGNFRNFLLSDAMLIAATMAGAFYTISFIERFSLADSYAGTFTVVMMTTTIFGNILFGPLADSFGHRLNMVLAASSTLLACLIAILAPSVTVAYIVFVLSASTISLSGISRLAFVAELCPEAERPTYIALANMITAPFVLFGIIGGWLADAYGFTIVFVIAGLFSGGSLLTWLLFIREPRRMNINTAIESASW